MRKTLVKKRGGGLYIIKSIGGQVGRVFAPSTEVWGFKLQVGSSQRLKNWQLLLPWLAFPM